MPPFTLVYLQAAHLADRLFLRDFYANFVHLGGKTLVLHERPGGGSASDTAFASKRISAQLSEAMVPGAAFSGYQRGLLRVGADGWEVNAARLAELWRTLDCIVLNAQAAPDDPGADAARALAAVRAQLAPARTVLPPLNPLSPLGSPPKLVPNSAEVAALLAAYPEEEAVLTLAQTLAPVVLAAPNQFGQLPGL